MGLGVAVWTHSRVEENVAGVKANILCPLCDLVPEDNSNTFWYCVKAHKTWKKKLYCAITLPISERGFPSLTFSVGL